MIPALIGLGIAIAGTAMQVRAQNQQQKATNAAIWDQIRQQQALSERAKPVLQKQLAASTTPEKSLDEGRAKAMRTYEQVQTPKFGQFASPLTTGQTANDPFARGQQTLGNVAAAGNARWSQFQLDQAINDSIARGDLAMLEALSKNASSDYTTQLGAAQNTGAGLAGVGSLAQSIGGVMGMYSATKPAKVPLSAVMTNSSRGPGTDFN